MRPTLHFLKEGLDVKTRISFKAMRVLSSKPAFASSRCGFQGSKPGSPKKNAGLDVRTRIDLGGFDPSSSAASSTTSMLTKLPCGSGTSELSVSCSAARFRGGLR